MGRGVKEKEERHHKPQLPERSFGWVPLKIRAEQLERSSPPASESVLVAAAAVTTVSAISAVATVTPVAPSTTTATATKTAFTRRTFLTRAGDVNGQLAALEFLVMEHLNRLVRFLARAVLDKGEASGLAGELVEHDVHGTDHSGLGEILLQVTF